MPSFLSHPNQSVYPIICLVLRFLQLFFFLTEHTQDKHIQRDDEYYEGDNDNDHNMDDV